MNQEHLIKILGEWGVNAAFIIPFLFPFVVRLYWDWTKSSWGWNIVTLELAIALALIRSFLVVDFNISRGAIWFEWLTVVSLWAIPIIIVWRAYIIWHRQRHVENPENNGKKELSHDR